MVWKTIGFEEENGLALVRLNRPEALNALDRQMAQDLYEVCERCSEPDIRAMVLSGAGRAFCAGGDLKEIEGRIRAGERMEEFLWPDYQKSLAKLYEVRCPTIAAVHGFAVGAGCDIALACDIRLAGAGASFGQVYSRVGLVPDCGGTFFLPRVVGSAKALELILTGDVIDAEAAFSIGLVRSVHNDDALMEEAIAPSVALRAAKKLIRSSGGLDVATALRAEAGAQAETVASLDFQEGIAAFLEKRKPGFQGK
ncbi:MAG: enoyl-CoA hydratase/isomerase family protein [Nitrospinae bacterium]|nr:enoyl-CoA hydratase/isomerase family protein [Nitrospinota bacterium]